MVKHWECGILTDSVIRDRIVIEINEKQLPERLLRETDFSSEKNNRNLSRL